MFEVFLLFGMLGWAASPSPAEEKVISKEVVVEGSLEAVWQAWTTSEGMDSFFAPRCRIEARPEGVLEIWWAPEAPAGQRGAEGLMVLAVDRHRMLSFTWSAPAKWPEVRRQRTSVAVRFKALGDGQTRVRLIQSGWGEGREWDQVFDYFTQAWDVVLARLQHRFRHGPVDWANPPAISRP